MIKKPMNVNKLILTKKNLRIIMEIFSRMKFSNFYDTKDGMIEPTCERFRKWKQDGHPVKKLGVIMRVKNQTKEYGK